MAQELLKSNLHYDDINKIRILDPSVAKETLELTENSKDYESSCGSCERRCVSPANCVKKLFQSSPPSFQFQPLCRNSSKSLGRVVARHSAHHVLTQVRDFVDLINGLLQMLKELGDNVEKQKMAAIGVTNLLKSITKQRESEQAKLQAEINEKVMALEHLDAEYDSLQILEATQQETIEYLTQLR